MRNFQDTFETRKQSFSSAFPICMTVPLTFYHLKLGKKAILISKLFQMLIKFISKVFPK